MDRDNISIQTVIGVIFVIAALAIVPAVISVLNDSVDNQVTTKSLVEEASYIIYKDGDYCYLKDGTTGRIVSRSINDTDTIQTAFDLPGSVMIRNGEYVMDWHVKVPTGKTIAGESGYGTIISGNYTWIMDSVHDISINNLRFNYTQGIYVYSWTNESYNITLKDLMVTANQYINAAFYLGPRNGNSVNNITLENCISYYSDTYGFLNQDYPINTGILDNITYLNCKAIGSGINARFNDYVVGFDILETGVIKNSRYVNCIASDSWESGFHVELGFDRTQNVELYNCISINNGIKPSPTFGHGFMVEGGMTLYNCISEGNAKYGFYVVNKIGGPALLYNCVDTGSYVGFLTTVNKQPVEFHNCVSINATSSGIKLVDTANTYQTVLNECSVYDSRSAPLSISNYNMVTGSLRLISAGYSTLINASVVLGFYTYDVEDISLNIYLDTKGLANDAGVSICGSNVTLTGEVRSNATKLVEFDSQGGGIRHNDNVIKDMKLVATGDRTTRGIVAESYVYRLKVVNVDLLNEVSSHDIDFGITGNPDLTRNIVVKDVRFSDGWFAGNEYWNVLHWSNSGQATITAGNTSITVNPYIYDFNINNICVIPFSKLTTHWWIYSSGTGFIIYLNGTESGNVSFLWSYYPSGGIIY